VVALGRAIHTLRLERGLSIGALSGAAGLRNRYLAALERGERNPTWDDLNAIADALDTPRSIIYSEAEAHTVAYQIAQRSIVLRLLDEQHPQPWTRGELQRASPDIKPGLLAEALAQLAASGIAIIDGEQIHASRSARRLDTLGMVSI
jgi:transcriptional regulator with XRE-family HTH domain